jgi:hypothetical protein
VKIIAAPTIKIRFIALSPLYRARWRRFAAIPCIIAVKAAADPLSKRPFVLSLQALDPIV